MSCKCSSLSGLCACGGVGLASGPICTTGDCEKGRISIQEMRTTFNALSGNPDFDSVKFRSAVESLEALYAQNTSFFSEWIPFNPNCCAVADIGVQADTLTTRMLQSVGAAPLTPPASAAGFDLNSLMALGGILLGVMFLSNLKGLTR